MTYFRARDVPHGLFTWWPLIPLMNYLECSAHPFYTLLETRGQSILFHMGKRCTQSSIYESFPLTASAWETGVDLEKKVGRFRLNLAHKVVMWTYVICQSFRFNSFFFSRVLDISPSRVPRGWFSVQFWPLFNLSFSNIQLISDKTKTIFVKPYL